MSSSGVAGITLTSIHCAGCRCLRGRRDDSSELRRRRKSKSKGRRVRMRRIILGLRTWWPGMWRSSRIVGGWLFHGGSEDRGLRLRRLRLRMRNRLHLDSWKRGLQQGRRRQGCKNFDSLEIRVKLRGGVLVYVEMDGRTRRMEKTTRSLTKRILGFLWLAVRTDCTC